MYNSLRNAKRAFPRPNRSSQYFTRDVESQRGALKNASSVRRKVFTNLISRDHRYIVLIVTLRSGSMHNYFFLEHNEIQLWN